MPFAFTRHTDGPANKIFAAHLNELQQGVETLGHGVFNVMEPVDSAQSADYARGDGTTDDSGAFATADANNAGNGVTYAPPTSASYLFSASKTLSHALRLPPGAKLKPASGVTITLNGPLLAGAYQVFDTSAGGTVALGPGACETVHAAWWGASPSASADVNTSAINAATVAVHNGLLRGTVRFDRAGTYQTNGAITWLSRVRYAGQGTDYIASDATIIHNTTTTTNVFDLDPTADSANFDMEGIIVQGGKNGIASSVVNTWITLTDVVCEEQANAGLYIATSAEEWHCYRCRFGGGSPYGLQKVDSGIVGNNYIDKSSFHACFFSGASVHNIDIRGQVMNSVLFDRPTIDTSQTDGAYFDIGMNSVVFVAPNTEGNGLSGKSNICTGNMASGSGTLTITGALQGTTTGYSNGDQVTVEGAGQYGLDLVATVTGGGGTTALTLSASAQSTVAGAQVTNARYDEFVFIAAGSVVMVSQDIGGSRPGDGNIRYSINNQANLNLTLIGGSSGSNLTPIYDPLSSVQVIGGQNNWLRRANPNQVHYYTTTLPDNVQSLAHATVAGAYGDDLLMALNDSAGNGSGSFGAWRWKTNDPNFTQRMQLLPDGSLTPSRFVSGMLTTPNGGATPNVSDVNLFACSNSAATTITNFAGGTDGQWLDVIFMDGNTTIQHGGSIFLKSGANWNAPANSGLRLVSYGGKWYEMGGSA